MTFAQIFDIGTACALAFFVLRGARRGLTGEIVSLFGFAASCACSWMFSRPLADMVLLRFPNWDRALMGIFGAGAESYAGRGWDRTILEPVCAVVIFMAVSLAFALMAGVLRSLVRAARLSFLDHTLGALSGVLRVFFVLLVIYGGVTLFSSFVPSAWMWESRAMRTAAVAWPPVFKILTETGLLRVDRLMQGAASGAQNLNTLLDSFPSNSFPSSRP
ncbi:MAG: CvpA family protein [Synergistaceae bacterium]|jgi:uncharacterized membrane protein required for colicin V production|nr:CvpA family protein [Synergistaceae bacterium]